MGRFLGGRFAIRRFVIGRFVLGPIKICVNKENVGIFNGEYITYKLYLLVARRLLC